MDQSYSESDISMSPSQILERLQVLRQLQLMQRGKLQKQRLQYHETSESSSCITEIISHFTNSANSTSYNTFRSLLQSPQNGTADLSARHHASDVSQKVQEKDLIDGVSMLNLSQESECIINTPTSGRSQTENGSKNQVQESSQVNDQKSNGSINKNKMKRISLDEMPILSPKKDFETLVLEKMQTEVAVTKKSPKKVSNLKEKKPFLRRGEGMARFGVKKDDLKIMNTKALPWKKNAKPKQQVNKKVFTSGPEKSSQPENKNIDNLNVDIVVPPLKMNSKLRSESKLTDKSDNTVSACTSNNSKTTQEYETSSCSIHSEFKVPDKIIQQPIGKHPVQAKKGKTWASILTAEQTNFLMQLKQSEYYKNFASPTKSIVSDTSCDENTNRIRQEKETAEQNLFDLLENKVSNDSFSMNTSFFNRFLRRTQLECSGESTPIIMQKCLSQNPNLLHIYPESQHRKNEIYNDVDTCNSEYTECCSDVCSSVSTCCSCKTVEPVTPQCCKKEVQNKSPQNIQKEVRIQSDKNCQQEIDNNRDVMKANMEEMNAKLITTSEILKERLRELEDEIETFRKENINLKKMKEEIDTERQKFYEEKSNFEQKFNEEKILSEYYLAEEKDKLNKQKQMYERYVREMRGRLSKKDKDEVVQLKQEIQSLKEEIRLKDAKSTSTIARLRNQLKIIEKEKSELQNEVEKLKKENRRIQHSNEITRRMTNLKYLEQINKKLSNINRDTLPEVESSNDIKYKAFEIERQSRSRKVQRTNETTIRPRAKSVPNLKVQSRYAKYFSQRDSVSDKDGKIAVAIERHDSPEYNISDDEIKIDSTDEISEGSIPEDNSENNLEKVYLETFRPSSDQNKSNRNSDNYLSDNNTGQNTDGFFLRKSNSASSARNSKSPLSSISPNSNFLARSKSPVSIVSHRSGQKTRGSQNGSNYSNDSIPTYRSKSPPSSNLSQRSAISHYSSQKSATVIHKDLYEDKLCNVSPEPTVSRTSLTKTNLNPTEYKKPDGSKELRFPNGNVKYISADGKYSKFVYYNGDVKENFYDEGRIKYYFAESKTYHTTHPDGLEVLEFPDGQVEKRYKDGSSEVRLPNGSVRYQDPKNKHIREEWRFPDGSALTVSANGERRIVFPNGQIEVHADDHKRREFPDGTVKLVYNDGTSETRYATGRVRIKDKHGNLIMDSAAR